MFAILQAMAVSAPSWTYDLSSLTSVYTDKSSSDIGGNFGCTFHVRNTSDGTIDVVRVHNGDQNDEEVYVTPANGRNLWVRCTDVSGTPLNAGDATGSWHTLTSSQARSFGLTYTAGSGSPDLISSVIKLEIARDSGGTDIVADSGNTSIEIGNIGP